MFDAASYPFLNIMWTMFLFFIWVAFIWVVIVAITSVFRRKDLSGLQKATWVVLMILVPFIGVLAYIVVAHDHLGKPSSLRMRPADELKKGRKLLDEGVITQA